MYLVACRRLGQVVDSSTGESCTGTKRLINRHCYAVTRSITGKSMFYKLQLLKELSKVRTSVHRSVHDWSLILEVDSESGFIHLHTVSISPLKSTAIAYFPCRSVGFGFLSTFGRVAAMIGPQLVYAVSLHRFLILFYLSFLFLFCLLSTFLLKQYNYI